MKQHMNYDAADLAAVMEGKERLGIEREDEGIFLARQLDFVKARIYEVQTPNLTGLQLVPVSTEVPEWAESFTYRTYDEVGMAKFISNYADDLPRVDVTGKEETLKLKSIGDAYGYSLDEMRLANAMGTNLAERKGRTARRAIDQLVNKVALVGDTAHGFYGFTNHPNLGETAVTGDWTVAATTGDAILADLLAMYDAVLVQSYDNHAPNTLAVAPTRRSALVSKNVNSGGQFQSVWSAFQAIHPGVTMIASTELEPTADNSNVSTAVMYERDVDNLSIEVPRPFEQLPAEKRNLEMVIDCIAKCSGVAIYRPLALTKSVGV
ncbi:MAG: DNA-binding protein [Alteromonadaceae bacterium]|nr:DNA-binding protein [Alteromonadaceae bacterium]|tara:strand:- start:851 stop:1816 length:966 start_codon:yes stop_codon:yes gene_type:complete